MLLAGIEGLLKLSVVQESLVMRVRKGGTLRLDDVGATPLSREWTFMTPKQPCTFGMRRKAM